MTTDARDEAPPSLQRRLRALFHLPPIAEQSVVRSAVVELVPIRNEKLWFLIASAVIASVGLDTNSAAVVIGAMLVSPLMGPIVGLGWALAVRDRRLAALAGRNLAVSVGVSLLVSAAYFRLSPLGEATSELLARTKPNLLDLLVALAAATAGVIALASAEVSATLPGVAIATAIMPPLCTAGFGLARGEPRLGLGAFYLFVVNAVAIALCAYLLFGRMHFRRLERDSEGWMPRWVAAGLTLMFVAPLAWSLWQTSREHRLRREAQAFVTETSRSHRVATWSLAAGSSPTLTLFLFDQPTPDERLDLVNRASSRLPGASLQIETADLSPRAVQEIERLKSSLVDTSVAPKEVRGLVEESRRQTQARREAVAQEVAARQQAEARDERDRFARECAALDRRVVTARWIERESGPWLVVVSTAKAPGWRGELELRRRLSAWVEVRLGHPVTLAFAVEPPAPLEMKEGRRR